MDAGAPTLAGRRIAVTGRLASRTRDAVVAEIEARGGTWTEHVDERTDLLVIGLDGWPLRNDGHLTRDLERARALEAAGHPIRIVDEPTFLREAELDAGGLDGKRQFTLGQLARVLDIPVGRLRSLIRRGLVRPSRVERRLSWFDFTEVARARSLQSLLDQGVTLRAIRNNLRLLERWMPDAQTGLNQLDLLEGGNLVVVHTPEGQLAEPSGQLRFAFADDAPQRPEPLPLRSTRVQRPTREGPRRAEEWFVAGVAAEDSGRLEDAVHAYHQALIADGPQAEVCFNFGNALIGLGLVGEAAQRFMQAVEIDPEYVEAWNNLGNALSELGRITESVRAYETALEIEPAYADAHFNLAETLLLDEQFEAAGRHFQAYLDTSPHAADRDYIERTLAECMRRQGVDLEVESYGFGDVDA